MSLLPAVGVAAADGDRMLHRHPHLTPTRAKDNHLKHALHGAVDEAHLRPPNSNTNANRDNANGIGSILHFIGKANLAEMEELPIDEETARRNARLEEYKHEKELLKSQKAREGKARQQGRSISQKGPRTVGERLRATSKGCDDGDDNSICSIFQKENKHVNVGGLCQSTGDAGEKSASESYKMVFSPTIRIRPNQRADSSPLHTLKNPGIKLDQCLPNENFHPVDGLIPRVSSPGSSPARIAPTGLNNIKKDRSITHCESAASTAPSSADARGIPENQKVDTDIGIEKLMKAALKIAAESSASEDFVTKLELIDSLRELQGVQEKIELARENGILVGKLGEVTDERDKVRDKFEELNAAHASLRVQLRDSEFVVEKLQKDLNDSKLQLKNQQSSNLALEQELAHAASTICTIQAEVARLAEMEVQLNVLSTELRQARCDEASMKSRINSLSMELKNTQEAVCAQRARADAVVKELNCVRNELAHTRKHLEQVVDERNQFQAVEEHKDLEIEQLTTNLKAAVSEAARTKDKLQEQEWACNEQADLISELERRNLELHETLNTVRSKLSEEQCALKSHREALDKKESDCIEIQVHARELQGALDALYLHRERDQTEIQNLKQATSRVTAALEDALASHALAIDDKEACETRISELQQHIEELTTCLHEKSMEAKRVEGDLNTAQEWCKMAELAKEELETNVQRLMSELDNEKKRVIECEEQLEEEARRVSALQNEKVECEMAIGQLEAENRNLNRIVGEQSGNLETTMKRLEENSSAVEGLRQVVLQKDSALSQLQETMESLQLQRTTSELAIQEQQQQVQELKKICDQRSAALSNTQSFQAIAEAKVSNLATQLEATEKELEGAILKRVEVELQLAAHIDESNNQTKEIQHLLQKIKVLKDSLVTLEEDLREKELQFNKAIEATRLLENTQVTLTKALEDARESHALAIDDKEACETRISELQQHIEELTTCLHEKSMEAKRVEGDLNTAQEWCKMAELAKEELETNVQRLMSELDNEKKRVIECEEQLEEEARRVSALQNEKVECEMAIGQLEAENRNLNRIVGEQSGNLETTMKRLEENGSALEGLRQVVLQKDSALSQLQETMESLQLQRTTNELTIQEQQQRIQALENERVRFEDALSNQETFLSLVEAEASNLVTQLDAKEKELAQAKAEREEVERELVAHLQESNNQTEEIQGLQHRAKELTNSLGLLEVELKMKESLMEQHMNQHEELVRSMGIQLIQRDTTISALELENEKQAEEITNLKQQVEGKAQLDLDLAVMASTLKEKDMELQALSAQVKDLSSQYVHMEEDMELADTILKESESKNKDLKVARDELESCVTQLQVDNERLHQLRDDLESQLQQRTQDCLTLKAEVVSAKGELAPITVALCEAEHLIEQKDNEIKDIRKMYEASEARVRDMCARLNNTLTVHEASEGLLASKAERANKDLVMANERLLALQSRVTVLEEELDVTKKDREETNRKMKAIHAQLEGANTRACVLEMELSDKHQTQGVAKQLSQTILHLESELVNTRIALARSKAYESQLEATRTHLHNRVLQLQGNIRVFVRVRPPIGDGSALVTNYRFPCTHRTDDRDEVEVVDMNRSTSGVGTNPKPRVCKFVFDKVFGPCASQEVVYSQVQPLVQSVVDGYPVCMLAYGQTSSGKTYTMVGAIPQNQGQNGEQKGDTESQSPLSSNSGVVVRAAVTLFETIEGLRERGWVCDVRVGVVEVYNDAIKDLMCEPMCSEVFIRHSDDRVELVGAQMFDAQSAADIIRLVCSAMGRRCTKQTRVNEDSSRSHCVFSIDLFMRNPDTGATRTGTLRVVDLAGSERVRVSGAIDDPVLLKEATFINKSLSALSHVFAALQRNTHAHTHTPTHNHVPFRDSTLTHLLQPCLTGDCKVAVICTVSPEPCCLSESLSTLRFARKVNGTTPSPSSV